MHSTLFSFLMIALTLLTGLRGMAQSQRELETYIDQEYAGIEQLYNHLHAHPELSFHEKETAATLTSRLRQIGFEVTTEVGGHGIVAVLNNGPGPTLLVRTDLDALPVKELTGLPYASEVRTRDDAGEEVSVMHACGHDIHMSVFIGTAQVLHHFRKHWKGTLVMIGQPAEERGAGAKAMLADGLFTRFPKPKQALALHVNAEIPAGSVGFTPGYSMANVDSVDIIIRGVGGHGAFPHTTHDPIVLAAQTIVSLQTIVSREIDPIEPAVVTVGSIHAGTKHNIIPSEARLQLTIRSFSDEVRAQTLAAIKRIVRGNAIAAGIPEDRMPTVIVNDEYTPASYNDPQLTERLAGVFRRVLGEARVLPRKPMMGGEDFGRYGRTEDRIPICMYGLGVVDPKKMEESQRTGQPLPSLHSPFFAPLPQPTIKTGIRTMVSAVIDLAK